ncbi:hypothetical protein KEM52_005443 [Ascosphaera acerosa]|nr:hypothetical protein KEM52_005443 [Ascosphaera acerosa]
MATKYAQLPPSLLIISLKMYFPPMRTVEYLKDLLETENHVLLPQNRDQVLVALIPDFLTLWPCAQMVAHHFPEVKETSVGDAARPLPLMLGAQDCFWEAQGAYTGEVSPLHLKQLGVSLVELGHAERRRLFGETDEQVARKARAASRHGLIPLVCLGELNGPGPVSLAVQSCAGQVRRVLDAVDGDPETRDAPLIFAYEPMWAMGNALPASLAHVEAVTAGLREVIGRREGQVRILYGGSAQPGSWTDGGLQKVVDGLVMCRFAHSIDGARLVMREIEDRPTGLM